MYNTKISIIYRSIEGLSRERNGTTEAGEGTPGQLTRLKQIIGDFFGNTEKNPPPKELEPGELEINTDLVRFMDQQGNIFSVIRGPGVDRFIPTLTQNFRTFNHQGQQKNKGIFNFVINNDISGENTTVTIDTKTNTVSFRGNIDKQYTARFDPNTRTYTIDEDTSA